MMIMKSCALQALLLIGLMMLAGCGPRDTRYMPKLGAEKFTLAESAKDDVMVTAHLMSRKESEAYFGVDVIAEGYRPLILKIENKSLNSYVLHPSYLPMPRVSGKEISRLMHYDTYQRVVWLTLPALFLAWELVPIVIVPYGLSCRHYNHKTTRNVRKNTLRRTETLRIAPYEVVEKFVFVPESAFRSQFELTLYNETLRAIETFSVDAAAQWMNR